MRAALLFTLLCAAIPAAARDDGRWANSGNKDWFDSLRSDNGPCCSDADGSAVSSPDWDIVEGHYRVRLLGRWCDVPDTALVKVPNRVGHAMVWPVYQHALGGIGSVSIRCFMPGSES
jgi:hypothetical protein